VQEKKSSSQAKRILSIAYRVSLAWATANRLHRHFLKEVFVNHLPTAQKQHWQIVRAIRTGGIDEENARRILPQAGRGA
jgi:hypothetical protein